MKAITVLVIIITFNSWGQVIPNGNFDNWSGSPLLPDSWACVDKISGTGFPSIVSQATGHIDHGVKLSNVVDPSDTNLIYSGQVSIGQTYGYDLTIFGLGVSQEPAIEIFDRPDSLVGWFDFSPAQNSNSACAIESILTKWNQTTQVRDTIAYLNFTEPNATNGFQRFSVAYTYFSNESPDSASILLSSAEIVAFGAVSSYSPSNGTYVVFDELEFKMNNASISENENFYTPEVYPNPTSDVVSVQTSPFEHIMLVGENGTIVKEFTTDQSGRATISMDGQKSGRFFVISPSGSNDFILVKN